MRGLLTAVICLIGTSAFASEEAKWTIDRFARELPKAHLEISTIPSADGRHRVSFQTSANHPPKSEPTVGSISPETFASLKKQLLDAHLFALAPDPRCVYEDHWQMRWNGKTYVYCRERKPDATLGRVLSTLSEILWSH